MIMKQPKFPTILTVLSALVVAAIVHYLYFSYYRVPFFIPKGHKEASFVLLFLGVPPILSYLYHKIADYHKELQSEKIERILEILAKYQIKDEDYREVRNIFWGVSDLVIILLCIFTEKTLIESHVGTLLE